MSQTHVGRPEQGTSAAAPVHALPPLTGKVWLSRRTMLVAGPATIALAACGLGDGGTAQGTGSATLPPTQVRLGMGSSWAIPERMDWINRTIEQFNRTNAPHSAELHSLGASPGPALIPLLASGTAPDVALLGGQNIGIYADGGNLVEIGGYVKRDKLDLNKWYLPAEGEGYIRAGKQYGMPFYVSITQPHYPRNSILDRWVPAAHHWS